MGYHYFEKFYQAPKDTLSRCTHDESMSGDYEMIKFCEKLPVNECDIHDHCVYTFDKAPSTVAGTCTHKA